MSNTKHTPAPWDVTPRYAQIVAYERRGCATGWERVIARMAEEETLDSAWHPITQEELRANARVMAAAPEMLAMLKHIERTGCDDFDRVMLRDLISKAEGR